MKRIASFLLALCLLFTLVIPASADSELQYNYSTSANSGKRHETCTTLLGTSVDDYYTGSYTYENLSQQNSSTLLSSLRDLMTDTHKKSSSYADCRDYAVNTDCENGDGRVVLFYTSYSATRSNWISGSTGWNREHVWPQSLGGFKTSGAGSDLHHIRPSDSVVNSTRGNKKFGNVNNGSTAKGQSYTGNAIGGTYNGSYFEPEDNVKGDVARIILYMYARYGGDSSYTCSSVTTVFQSVDVLLDWCALDPVDTWEMGRNEVVANIQGNRNVFIDYPELAWLLFDEEIPENLTSPSSGTPNDEEEPCNHSSTEIRGSIDATCTEKGYTGDIKCTQCGIVLEAGEEIAELGHDKIIKNAKEATCCTKGYTGDTYCSVCNTKFETGKNIPATGQHTWGDWEVYKQPTSTQPGYEMRYCTNEDCDEYQKKAIPALGNNETDSTESTTDPDDGRDEDREDYHDDERDEDDRDQAVIETEPTQPSTEPSLPPETTDPLETEPVETEPVETEPVETEPVETEPAETEPAETTLPSTEPATSQPQRSDPTGNDVELPDQEKPGNSNNTWIIICGILLAACVAGIFLFFLPKNQKEDKYGPEADPREKP